MLEPTSVEIIRTGDYSRWFDILRDARAKAIILTRLRRVELGLLGDAKALGGGLGEIRVDHGPGYRLYFIRHGAQVIVLLAGGDKSRQSADIARARELAAAWRRDHA